MTFAATTGQLRFDDPDLSGFVIDRATTADDLLQSRLIKPGSARHIGTQTYITPGRFEIHGQFFDLSIHLEGNTIDRIILVAITGDEASSWDDWSMQAEMERKILHEAWAHRVFGKPLEVMPFFTPNRVMPFDVKEDTARYAQFDWGQVISSYDSKGSQSVLVLRYGAKDPQ